MDFTGSKPIDEPLTFSEGVSDALLDNPELGLKLAHLAEDLHALRRSMQVKQSELMHYYTDRSTTYKVGEGTYISSSKHLLKKEETPAGVLLVALKNVLGPGVNAWSPDTIWMELEKHEGLDIPLVNRDKILAALTLIEMPAFYWEVNTFKNTVMAFNNVLSLPDSIQEALPGQLAWAIYEAEVILHEHQLWEPEIDYEPILYVTECLHREGFILAPAILSFAQDTLNKRNKDGSQTSVQEVKLAWESMPKKDFTALSLGESSIDIQLAKLVGVQLYIEQRVKEYSDALKSMRNL